MNRDFLASIEHQPFYALIARKYKGKVARRSGVPYLNHIREGALILHLLFPGDEETIEAYCLHPLFQSDRALAQLLAEGQAELMSLSPRVIVLAMEYRRVANAYSITHKVRRAEDTELGPLEAVRRMLIADKIQNKKDFLKHINGKYQRSSYARTCERSLRYCSNLVVERDGSSGVRG